MTDYFKFPENYRTEDIAAAITAVEIKRTPRNSINWKQSTVSITVGIEQKTVPVLELIFSLGERGISNKKIQELLAPYGAFPSGELVKARASYAHDILSGRWKKNKPKATSASVSPETSATFKKTGANQIDARLPASFADQDLYITQRAKSLLKTRLKLTTEESSRLPTFSDLQQVMHAIYISNFNRMMNLSAATMYERQDTYIDFSGDKAIIDIMETTQKSEGYIKTLHGSKGMGQALPASEITAATKTYRDILADLVARWRGEKPADALLAELSRRLSDPDQGMQYVKYKGDKLLGEVRSSMTNALLKFLKTLEG